MKFTSRYFLFFTLLTALLSGFLFSCSNSSVRSGMLILTKTPSNTGYSLIDDTDSLKIPDRSEIVAVDPKKPSSAILLTGDFVTAFSPRISYDGKYMLFCARQKEGDPLHIFEMNLKNLKYRNITSGKNNSISPAYLPGDRFLFSRMTVNDTVTKAYSLFTCRLDGSDLKQITFGPQSFYSTTVLSDGRLLAICRNNLPATGDHFLMVMRPDGTKAEMFYKGTSGTKLNSTPSESSDGKIYFIETVSGTDELVSINYNRPLHSRETVLMNDEASLFNVTAGTSGECLYSCSKKDAGISEVYEVHPYDKGSGEIIYSDTAGEILDVTIIEETQRPKKLPSEVDMQVKTGLLLCQDINYLFNPSDPKRADSPLANRIRISGIDSIYGIVSVEKDGSFYLKVMADKPFRIETLDEKGNVINGPCSWIWLRPNERRGCVGCHQDPELTPENRSVLAVGKPPVKIPVHITSINEKDVELE